MYKFRPAAIYALSLWLAFVAPIAVADQSNINFIVEFDANQLVESTPALSPDDPSSYEFAAQNVAAEMLRLLMASGMSTQEYNDMTDEAWNDYRDQATFNASLNVVATEVNHLSVVQRSQAANIGGNFFEHGHDAILAPMTAMNKLHLKKLVGLF